MNIPANRVARAIRPAWAAREIETAPADRARQLGGLLVLAIGAAMVGALVAMAAPMIGPALETVAAIKAAN